MNKYFLLLVSALLININSSFAQKKTKDDEKSKLIAGPMLSYIDNYHAQMWLLVSKETKEVTIKMENFDEDRNKTLVYDLTNPKSFNNSSWFDFHVSDYNNGDEIPVVLTIEELLPDSEYHIEIYLDSVMVEEDMEIYTPRNFLADIYFLLGHNLNLSHANEKGDKILNTMSEFESDFMVWMGNCVSFNKNESNSFKKMLEKYKSIRKRQNVNHFMKQMPHIAIWNDKDFGLNTSDTRFALKDSSLMAFNLFWPNAPKKIYNYTFREYGVYKRYDYEDVEIFMMDNRMFKTSLNQYEPKFFGDNQMNRFINEIMGSDAAFKFIICGNSILTEGKDDEPFQDYSKEYEEFMRRLHLSRINGVLFITGDTDKTQLIKEDRKNAYPLYELKFPGLSPEGLFDGNFAHIKVEGEYRKRICSIQVYDEIGKVIFKKRIHQTEISY